MPPFLRLLPIILLIINPITFAAPPYGNLATDSTIDPAVMQIDENKYLGSSMQADYVLIDNNGKEFKFQDLIGKPLILLLSYYACNGTCPIINSKLKQVLTTIDRFQIGTDYQVLTLSFDQNDNSTTMQNFVKQLDIPEYMEQGWYHVVFKNQDIASFTKSIGYKYFWSRKDKIFLHPNVLIFITPEGRVARYLYGTTLDKDTIELALIDADWNRIANSSNVIDILTGVCYSYNFAEGKYTINYSLFISLASLTFGITIIGLSLLGFSRKHKKEVT